MAVARTRRSPLAPAWRRLLRRHASKTLVELCRRPRIEQRLAGFVLDFSDELVLLHRLDWDTFALDGYTLLRQDDIEQKRFFAREEYWQAKAVKKLKLRSRSPGKIRLDHWPEVIADIADMAPLIHVEREIRFPDACWIGTPIEVNAKELVIENLDQNGEWTGPYRMKIADITRLDFGGGYERALALTAPARPRPRRR